MDVSCPAELDSRRVRRPWSARFSKAREQREMRTATAATEAKAARRVIRHEEERQPLALKCPNRGEVGPAAGSSEMANAGEAQGREFSWRILGRSGIWPQL